MPSLVAASPVVPASIRSPSAESVRAAAPVTACNWSACRPRPVGLAEGHPVGHLFVIGPAEVQLDLVTRLRVGPGLGKQAGDVGVHIHHEYRVALASEHVQLIDVKLAGLGRQERRVETMQHTGSLTE